MSGRKMEESIQIRRWIEAALRAGCTSPSRVLEWIEQEKDDGMDSPTLPTIGRVMKEKGYKPTGIKWEKKKGE